MLKFWGCNYFCAVAILVHFSLEILGSADEAEIVVAGEHEDILREGAALGTVFRLKVHVNSKFIQIKTLFKKNRRKEHMRNWAFEEIYYDMLELRLYFFGKALVLEFFFYASSQDFNSK